MDNKMRIGRKRADGSFSGAIGEYLGWLVKKSEANNFANDPGGRRKAPGRRTYQQYALTLASLAEVAQECGLEWVHELSKEQFTDALTRRIAIAAESKRCQGVVMPKTVSTYKDILRAFTGYCAEERAISLKRWKSIKFVLRSKDDGGRQYKLVPFEDWPVLLAAAKERHLLDVVIIALGLFLYMRESEISRLKWRDLDLAAGIARFRRDKDNGEFLENPISDDLLPILLVWQSWLRTQFDRDEIPSDWYVVPARIRNPYKGQKNPRMNPSWPVNPDAMIQACDVVEAVKLAAKSAGFTDVELHRQGVHLLRRSAAEHTYLETGDYRLVAGFLGHGTPGKPNIKMTMRYLGHTATMEKKRSAVNKRSVFEPGLSLNLREVFALPPAIIVPSFDDLLPAPTKELAMPGMPFEEMLAALENETLWDELVTRYRPQEFLEEALKRTMSLSAARQMAVLEKCRNQFDLAVERAGDRRVLVAA